jgi:hypothetical protein
MKIRENNNFSQAAPHLRGLLRHFADLRDGTHGAGALSRSDKEQLFAEAISFINPFALQALVEMNRELLLGNGTVTAGGFIRMNDGDCTALWTLRWPEQEQAAIPPVTIEAFFGRSFHHPHLRGATVGVWPLNVFSADDAAKELPLLRAIAAADLHNLVFQRDWRIIPAMTRG